MELLFLLIIVILWVSYKEKSDELTDIKFPYVKKFREEMEEIRERRREVKREEMQKKKDGISMPSSVAVEQDKYVVEANENLEKLKEQLKKNPPKVVEEVKTPTKNVVYYLDGKPHKWEGGKFTPIED